MKQLKNSVKRLELKVAPLLLIHLITFFSFRISVSLSVKWDFSVYRVTVTVK